MEEFQEAARINLPPPFKLVAALADGDPFAHAQAIASPESAGVVVLGGDAGRVAFALVLEPEQALSTARRVHYAGMTALADALAAVSPPVRPFALDWPDRLRDGAATLAQARLAWPVEASEDAVPDWLIFAADVRALRPRTEDEIAEPAAAAWFRRRLVETFVRQFMRALDRWYEQGFAALVRDVDARLSREGGIARSIADNGDLLLHAGTGEPRRLPLAQALAAR